MRQSRFTADQMVKIRREDRAWRLGKGVAALRLEGHDDLL